MTNWYKKQVQMNGGKVPAHLAHATKLTRMGELDMTNKKVLHASTRKKAWQARQAS